MKTTLAGYIFAGLTIAWVVLAVGAGIWALVVYVPGWLFAAAGAAGVILGIVAALIDALSTGRHVAHTDLSDRYRKHIPRPKDRDEATPGPWPTYDPFTRPLDREDDDA